MFNFLKKSGATSGNTPVSRETALAIRGLADQMREKAEVLGKYGQFSDAADLIAEAAKIDEGLSQAIDAQSSNSNYEPRTLTFTEAELDNIRYL